jgi:hypothetical protein
MADCFISYSRRDAPFVARLVEALKGHNKVPWVDLRLDLLTPAGLRSSPPAGLQSVALPG